MTNERLSQEPRGLRVTEAEDSQAHGTFITVAEPATPALLPPGRAGLKAQPLCAPHLPGGFPARHEPTPPQMISFFKHSL